MDVNQRLSETLEIYIQYHGVEGSTPSTIVHKRKELGLFFRFLQDRGHSMETAKVTISDCLAHLENMRERGLAPASVQTRCRSMRAFFKWATDWEFVKKNPTALLKMPRAPKISKPFLKKEDFEAVLNLCPLGDLLGSRRQSVLWILATTGMRRQELAGLMLEDLNWKDGWIRVMGKGQKERRVPFAKRAQRVVLRYIQRRHDTYPHLWVTEEGRPITNHGLGEDISRMFKRAKVEVVDVFHIFRRTWAANSVRQGIPRPYTQAIAGWSTPTMMDRYTAAMQAEEGAIQAFETFDPFGQ